MASPASKVESNYPEAFVRLEHLKERAWIGFGAAVEWIAGRGKPIPQAQYDERLDGAVAAILAELQRLDPASCAATVEGVPLSDPNAAHVSVPHGCWPSVCFRQSDFMCGAFYLVLVDDADEWGGALDGRPDGFTRLRVRTSFLLDRWYPGILEKDADKQAKSKSQWSVSRGAQYSEPAVKRFIEEVISHLQGMMSLTQREIEPIVRDRFLRIPRDEVRRIYGKMTPSHPRGPRGPRDPSRARKVQELREKMKLAQLRN